MGQWKSTIEKEYNEKKSIISEMRRQKKIIQDCQNIIFKNENIIFDAQKKIEFSKQMIEFLKGIDLKDIDLNG